MATNDLISTMFEEPEIAGLQRQRQLAQLLIQQGAQTPQNQMVNGLYVPVNPMERVANLGSLLMGMKSSENLDAKQSELAAALRQKEMGALQKYLQLKRGTPGQEGTPDFVQAGPMPDGSNIPVQPGRQAIAAVPGDAEAANMYAASNPYSKVLREMGTKGLMQDPKWEKYEMSDGKGGIKTGVINVNSPDPIATFRQGGTKMDYDYYKGVDEGYIQPGSQGMAPQGGMPPQGQPRAIGGFENSVANLWPREGGYTSKDGSSGAPANFGINQKFNPDIDVSKLTQDQAKQLYKTRYWDAIGADKLSPAAQEVAFDAAVNQGPEFAKQIVQASGGDPQKMIQMRAARYQETAQRSPEDAKNYQGWMNRLNGIQQNISQQGQAQAPSYGSYKNNPNLSPKENRQAAAKFETENMEAQQAKVKAAVDSADIIKEVATLLPRATGSGFGSDVKAAKAYFGIPTKESPQDAQLGVLGAKLVANVPRFKGADSDKDVAQYMAAAGDVANDKKPWGDRMAALKTIYELNKKYAPEAYAGMDTSMFSAQPVERPKLSDTGKVLKDKFTTTAGFKRIQ